MHHLLILGCSQRKTHIQGEARAYLVYDGPLFRILRKARKTLGLGSLDVYILSAKHGLIWEGNPIEDYDQEMTTARSLELQPGVSRTVMGILKVHEWASVFIALTPRYLNCFTMGVQNKLDSMGYRVRYAHGPIGQRGKQLRVWLEKLK